MNNTARALLADLVADAIWRRLRETVRETPAPSSGAALGGVTMEAPPPSKRTGKAETAQLQTGRDF
jgi:hypothetical protein